MYLMSDKKQEKKIPKICQMWMRASKWMEKAVEHFACFLYRFIIR